jgi:hypothetical protein
LGALRHERKAERYQCNRRRSAKEAGDALLANMSPSNANAETTIPPARKRMMYSKAFPLSDAPQLKTAWGAVRFPGALARIGLIFQTAVSSVRCQHLSVSGSSARGRFLMNCSQAGQKADHDRRPLVQERRLLLFVRRHLYGRQWRWHR